MVRLFPEYRHVDNWQVLEQMTIHAYDDSETPIEVVKVEIGTVYQYNLGMGWSYSATSYPIIRWLTKKEYEHFKGKDSVVVW